MAVERQRSTTPTKLRVVFDQIRNRHFLSVLPGQFFFFFPPLFFFFFFFSKKGV